jgi:ABC-type transporter Mla subunit MlaD
VNSEVKVGILFFLGLGLLLWFTFFTTQFGAAKGAYAVHFARVTRLKEGDAVTYNGVRIGIITEVAPVIDEKTKLPEVKVSFSVNSDRRKMVLIDEKSEFRIIQGLLGGSTMEIASRSGVPITPEAVGQHTGQEPAGVDEVLSELQAVIAENRQGLKDAIGSVKDNLDRFGKASDQIEGLVKENRPEIAKAITNFSTMSERIGNLIEENREEVKKAIQHFDEMGDQISQLVAENRKSLKEAIDKLPGTVDNVSAAMKSFGDAVEENRPNIKSALSDIAKATPKVEHIADNLDLITTQIASGQGSVGKLIFEDTLHDKAVQAVDSLNQRLEEIKPVTRGFSELKFYLGAEGGEDTHSGVATYGAYLRIEPAPWKFYQGGVSYRTAPTGRIALMDDPNKLNVDFDLLIGWRWFPDDEGQFYRVTAAAGLIDSLIGAVGWWQLTPNLSIEVMGRQKDNQRLPLDRRYEGGSGPMLRATVDYRLWNRIFIRAGGDDLCDHPGLWLGLRAELLDNDLRNITTVSALAR